MKRTRLLVAAGGLVLVAAVLAVLAYPAWSAARGDDARWVTESSATEVLDYDDERVLTLDDQSLLVLDRKTGEESRGGYVDWQERAALVPGGVLASADGRLALIGPNGRVVWEKQQVSVGDPEFDLVAVDLDAAVAVAALSPELNDGPSTLTAFALADGAPVWTMPDVARVGMLRVGTEPARPPGWPRSTALISVVRVGGYPPGTAAEPATWSLVSAATGEVAAEVVEGGGAGMPVAVGDVALRSQVPDCAELSIIGGPEVRWPGETPFGECDLVWLLDPERAVLTAWENQSETRGGADGVRLYSLAPKTGVVTELDWTGGYVDTIVDDRAIEMTRSWGRFLFSRGVVYDTETGEEKWRAEDAWLAGDTAVISEPVTGLDRLAAGANDESRWLRLADPATGEPTEGGYLAGVLYTVEVLDRGQALVLTGQKAALLG